MFKKILLPIDLEHADVARKAISLAMEEAKRSDSKLYVMTVAPGFGMPIVASFFDDATVKKAMKEVAKHLKKFVTDHIPKEFHAKSIVTEGNPPEQILKQATEHDIDLIIISGYDTELDQMLLGSCSAKVVRHSNCSVLVVKN
jgi:nucleotide-binding universal stress UspA family protein